MTELSIEHILILAIVTFVLYHFMNRCNYEKFNVGGMNTITECTDLIGIKKADTYCGWLTESRDNCSDYYTKSDGKGYFCVPDHKGDVFKCKQDDEICSKSKEIKIQNQYIKWVTDNRTFIGGPCNKCGGCGEQLDTYGRTVCKNDNTKWCWGIDHPRGNCDSTP